MRWRTSGSSANCTSCWISCLPVSSAGCDLPAMTSWIGRVGCEQQALEPRGVAQHQGEPLVGRHPAGEADGEHVGVEDVVDPAELGRLAPRLCHDGRMRRRASVDELLAHLALGGPDGVARAPSANALPRLLARRASCVPSVVAGQLEDLAVDPGRAVDAVGDRW